MFSDKKLIYVCEYIIGFTLLIIVLPFMVSPQPVWTNAHWWAYLLFIINSGFIFINSASEMRRRMELSDRLTNLEKTVADSKGVQNQSQVQVGPQRTRSEQLVGSVN